MDKNLISLNTNNGETVPYMLTVYSLGKFHSLTDPTRGEKRQSTIEASEKISRRVNWGGRVFRGQERSNQEVYVTQVAPADGTRTILWPQRTYGFRVQTHIQLHITLTNTQ